jgi:hypothetical protein
MKCNRYNVLIGLVLCLINAGALAGTPFTIIAEYNKDKLVEVAATPTDDYRFEPDTGYEAKDIRININDLPAAISSIEHRYTQVTAISNESEMYELDSLRKYSEWKMLPFPADQAIFTLKLPEPVSDELPPLKDILRAAKSNLPKDDFYDEWLKLAQQCGKKYPFNRCFTYKSEEQIRMILVNGKVIYLTLDGPKGC